MARFSKFNLVLKAESKAYKSWRAINVCEFIKIAKFANINRTRTFVDLQYVLSLDKLFDIAPSDLYYKLKVSGNPEWNEDWEWYQGQTQVPQVGSMSGRDKLLEERHKRREKREAQVQARVQREAEKRPAQPIVCTENDTQSVPPETSGYLLRKARKTSYAEAE